MADSPCMECRKWDTCSHVIDWYGYYEVRFCKRQIIWVLENKADLRIGKWPANPEGTSYIDPAVRTQPRSNASFEIPVSILAEVERRLNKTGEDGEDLRQLISQGTELTNRATQALNYVSGWRDRRMTYAQYRADKKYRKHNGGKR